MSTVIVGAGPRIATHGGRRGESKVPITPPTLITVKVGGQVQPLTPTTPIQSQRVVANNKTTTCGCGASDVLQENHPPRVAAGSGGSKCRHGGVNKGGRVAGGRGGAWVAAPSSTTQRSFQSFNRANPNDVPPIFKRGPRLGGMPNSRRPCSCLAPSMTLGSIAKWRWGF